MFIINLVENDQNYWIRSHVVDILLEMDAKYRTTPNHYQLVNSVREIVEESKKKTQ